MTLKKSKDTHLETNTSQRMLLSQTIDSDMQSTEIQPLIRLIRGQQVILDSDLALLYGIETKRLKEQVNRNESRFPNDFMFKLTQEEFESLRSQFATSNKRGGSRYLPYAFTESGIAMLSSVLRSDIAIEVNIRIMRAFTSMRQFLINNAQIFQRLANVEYHQTETDKRKDDVSATIYTQHINKQLQVDIERHNSQYSEIKIKRFQKAHDRFLLIDSEVYHIGASVKDLGKKWFAFTFMQDITAEYLIDKILKDT